MTIAIILLCLLPIAHSMWLALSEFRDRALQDRAEKTLLCLWRGHKMEIDPVAYQDRCQRRGCHYWRGVSRAEVEAYLDGDGDVDAGLCHEPPAPKRREPAVEVPF